MLCSRKALYSRLQDPNISLKFYVDPVELFLFGGQREGG